MDPDTEDGESPEDRPLTMAPPQSGWMERRIAMLTEMLEEATGEELPDDGITPPG